MKPKSLLPVLAAIVGALVLFHVPPIDASSIGGGPPPGGRDAGGRDSGSGKDAAAPRQPARTPSRTIVVPNIVVDEALLERLSTQPVPLPNNVSPAQRSDLVTVGRMIQAGNVEAAKIRWKSILGSYVSETTRGGDIAALMYFVMRESIENQNEDKKYWISKLKTHNTIADALSRHLRQLQELSREMAGREKRGATSEGRRTPAETVEIVTIVVSSPHVRPGTDNALQWEKRRMDRTALQEQIRYVERRLAADGDDKQMATLELQKATQKRSQFLNMLSNAMKALNQITMSVIRNLGS